MIKEALSVDDYARWKSINGASISGDGKWVTYVLSLTNTAPADARAALHLLRLDTTRDVGGSGQRERTGVSPDSKWIAYQVDRIAADVADAGERVVR
jgi:hypothetical protein